MKAFIGYVSMSGNTEDISNIIKDVLLTTECEVDMECLDEIEVASLLAYDCVFIGAYTWGDGDLPYEVEDFFEELNELDLDGIHAACFGSGEYAYPKFCGAVDVMADLLNERGCDVFAERLKIELSPEEDEQIIECQQFAKAVYEWALAKQGS